MRVTRAFSRSSAPLRVGPLPHTNGRSHGFTPDHPRRAAFSRRLERQAATRRPRQVQPSARLANLRSMIRSPQEPTDGS